MVLCLVLADFTGVVGASVIGLDEDLVRSLVVDDCGLALAVDFALGLGVALLGMDVVVDLMSLVVASDVVGVMNGVVLDVLLFVVSGVGDEGFVVLKVGLGG